MEKKYGWQLEVQWTTGRDSNLPPSGMVTPVTAEKNGPAALQPKDLVEAVHPSS